MALPAGGQSFADFAQTLNFGKGASVNALTVQNDETRTLVPKLAAWGTANTQSSTITVAPAPLVVGAPSEASDQGLTKIAKLGLGYVKSGFSALRDNAETAVNRTQERVLEAQESVNRYIYAGVSAVIGCFLIFLAFAFLPVIVFSPQKFALLFTMGSLFLINTVALLKGYGALMIHLCEKERVLFSLGYFGCMGFTLYATLALRSYLLTILFAALQLAFLIILLVSYGTGGGRVLSQMSSFSRSLFRKLFSSGGSLLPL